MNNNNLFESIVGPILYDYPSPYMVMMRLLKSLREQYYHSISVLGNELEPELGERMKHEIFDTFMTEAKRQEEREEELTQLSIKTIIKYGTQQSLDNELPQVLSRMRTLAGTQLVYHQPSPYSQSELRRKKAAAGRITLIERIKGNNSENVRDYFNSMVYTTLHTCQTMTRRRAAQYLTRLADEIEQRLASGGFATETATAAPSAPKQEYAPKQVEHPEIKLSPELMQLAEHMAENVHDVWAATRIEQGWTYGPERNDAEKKHPCLIPYDQLPEEEKVYDRKTSQETLRFILNNGFEINKMG